jgi:hypothetical protein
VTEEHPVQCLRINWGNEAGAPPDDTSVTLVIVHLKYDVAGPVETALSTSALYMAAVCGPLYMDVHVLPEQEAAEAQVSDEASS